MAAQRSELDRWADVRRERLDAETSKVRSWITRSIDRVEDRLPPSAVDVIERLRNGDVLLFAGGLAFYSLVSTVPSLLLIAWITGSLLGEDRVERLAERLGELAPGDVEIEDFIQSLLQVGMGVGVIALLVALWPATAFGSGLTRSFDALSVDRDPVLHGLRGRARALVVLAVLPLFVLGALGAAYLSTGLLGDGAAGTIAGWALAIVSGTFISWVAIVALYWWFGPAELAFRALAVGAAATAVAIALMSLGYLVYLAYGTNWEERVAGTGLAAMVLLSLWLYLANLLLLGGYCLALALGPGPTRARARSCRADVGALRRWPARGPKPGEQFLEQDAQLEAGERRARGSGDVRRRRTRRGRWVTARCRSGGGREHRFVAVRRRVEQQDAVALADLLAVDLDVAGGGAVHVAHRSRPPQHLLDRAGQQRRIGPQPRQLVGVSQQCLDAARDDVAGGLVAADEHEHRLEHDVDVGERVPRRSRRSRSGSPGRRVAAAALGHLGHDVLVVGLGDCLDRPRRGSRRRPWRTGRTSAAAGVVASGSPISSPIMNIGSGVAMSATMSHSPRSITESISSVTLRRR
jgi:membrane protein